ncbi:MAG: hypothetical protein O7E54_07005, partial [Planctomycetota bacterium]|nr:hypothetical protein [Planctomycetota bacterium]
MKTVLRRALVWSGLALLLPLTAHTIWTHTLSSEFEERLDEIRSRGEPVKFEELAPPRPPDERNAAPLYEKAKAWLDEHDDLECPDALLQCRDEWSDEDRVAVRAWVDLHAPFIE